MDYLKKIGSFCSKHHTALSCLLSTTLLVVFCSIELDESNVLVSRAAGVTVFMATLWLFTPIPVAVTALTPLILFPLLGIMSGKDTAKQYFSDTIITFIGSFFVADALERVNLHKRISIKLLTVLGVKPFWLLFGFCITTFLLSTCLSNTATTIMLMPLTVSVVDWMELRVKGAEEDEGDRPTQDQEAEAGAGSMRRRPSAKTPRAGAGVLAVAPREEMCDVALGFPSVESCEDDMTQGRNDSTNRLPVFAAAPSAPAAGDKEPARYARIRKALALGVAYSANIGGVCTLVGTPPNLVYSGQLPVLFEQAPPVTFVQWFVFAAPFGCFMLLLAFSVLSLKYCPPSFGRSKKEGEAAAEDAAASVLRAESAALGALRFEEGVVLGHAVALVLLWFTRKGEVVGGGWSQWMVEPKYATDGTAAILISLSLFLFPSKPWWRAAEEAAQGDPEAGEIEWKGGAGLQAEIAHAAVEQGNEAKGRILDASAINKLNWDIVLLLGGGFALAAGSKESGLASFLALKLESLDSLPPLLLLFIMVLLTSFVTEFNSNTASTNLLLPIVAQLSVALKVNPQAHMVATTMSCSFAFMLPVATAPNAIAFSTKAITIKDMLSTGIILNTIACVLITFWVAGTFSLHGFYGEPVFTCPAWAHCAE